MSKPPVPLKIVTPKSKQFTNLRNLDFFTLDINGRSYSPQNQQDHIHQSDYMNKTVGSNYQSKKFKVRTASNFVKTARNWKNLPFQRIKHVENVIKNEKMKEKLRQTDTNDNAKPSFSFMSSPVSPRTTQTYQRNLANSDLYKRTQVMRQKQIQQLIKLSKPKQTIQKSSSPQNMQKIKYLQSKPLSLQINEILNLSNQELSPHQFLDNKKQNQFRINNKSNNYSDMVKNRRKLVQKRQSKKKSADYSLLGRINLLQQYQEISFVLRNSLQGKRKDVQDEF